MKSSPIKLPLLPSILSKTFNKLRQIPSKCNFSLSSSYCYCYYYYYYLPVVLPPRPQPFLYPNLLVDLLATNFDLFISLREKIGIWWLENR